jgi:hypothetical protein
MRIIDLAGIEILPGDYKKLRPERVDELARRMRIKRKKGYLMPPTGFLALFGALVFGIFGFRCSLCGRFELALSHDTHSFSRAFLVVSACTNLCQRWP